ncbi:cytochrome c1 [Pacificimonas flava]|uniref:Cytochrome c1 n=1 Tax=Pacificimonas flava TaxID=1234595 RepID=M2U6M9_9SPHN|nr:cytochrome c1 [Pacificimonas flava]EMD83653.1 ubiquinol cytochrome C oxidoreductase, cytochrome C1 subunit [Pacificimonas flava]MBB5280663.1 ubiquinol-cytochrome c reductase cytochrome c1 subunit [Pacificimonas flava]
MVRLIGFAAGIVFVFVLALAALAPREASVPDPTEEFHEHPEDIHWSWEGPMGLGVFGGFDKAQLQRGFKVYREVCSSCHSLKRVAFRNLEDLGFNEAEVKVIAEEWPIEVPAVNPDTGEATTQPATASDRFPLVYPNEVAARAANNNAAPPDMSLLAKSREGGADYIHALITGYEPVPAEFPQDRVQESLHYNPQFHSLWIAMPPQLSDGLVTYDDGTEATVDQMGRDVAAFLYWAAEPKLEQRKAMGLGVIIFLIGFSVFAYLAYRKVWADVKSANVGGPGTRSQVDDKGLHARGPGERG